jgi:hypothetical protein
LYRDPDPDPDPGPDRGREAITVVVVATAVVLVLLPELVLADLIVETGIGVTAEAVLLPGIDVAPITAVVIADLRVDDVLDLEITRKKSTRPSRTRLSAQWLQK